VSSRAIEDIYTRDKLYATDNVGVLLGY